MFHLHEKKIILLYFLKCEDFYFLVYTLFRPLCLITLSSPRTMVGIDKTITHKNYNIAESVLLINVLSVQE